MRATAHWSGKVSVLAIVSALAATGGACGKSEELALDDFGEEAARTTCDKVYECCMATDSVVAGHMSYGGGREMCGSKTRDYLGFWAAVIDQERDKGRLEYDARLARRCLDAYAVATCEAHKANVPLDGCEAFVIPRTAPGGACAVNESCLGGECVGGGEGKEGTCRALATEGQSCDGLSCAKGLRCDGSGGAKVCRPKRAAGEACSTNAECQSAGCNKPSADAAGTCGPRGGAQGRCFVTTGCSFGGAGTPGGAGLVALLGVLALGLAVRGGRVARARRRERGLTSRRC